MSCCPFLAGFAGHPPFVLFIFVVFCFISIVIMIKKLDAIIKLLEKK